MGRGKHREAPSRALGSPGALFRAEHLLTIESIWLYDSGTPGGAMGKSWPRSGSIVTALRDREGDLSGSFKEASYG